ncbi:MAG: hypothetical protein GY913_21005 [Proteobacteria bacterium]|nr:hypothetical protein [Pseudomonadota bacterium]MCP4919387.1 hypothetical protein [Pseudomonadota bacterium]
MTLDPKVQQVLDKYTDDYDIVSRLKKLMSEEEVGALLWRLDAAGSLDCSTGNWFWSTMDDAPQGS